MLISAPLAASLALAGALAFPQAEPTSAPVLDEEFRALALEFSPLPPLPPDPSNAYADDPAAARLGQALFFDRRLSRDGTVSCATCHDPGLGWADGRPLAKGLSHHPRHTLTLLNVAWSRWFFWDGRADSLWSQALGPLEDPREHGFSRLELAHLVAGDADLARAYREVFGELADFAAQGLFPARARPVPAEPTQPDHLAWMALRPESRHAVDRIFVATGKAIAAFERRLAGSGAPFDRFVEGLREGDPEKRAALSPAAQRGFMLFAGKARCSLCHDGPYFSDLEFHDTRLPSEEGADLGRALGIKRLLQDPFNGVSEWADDGGAAGRLRVGILPVHQHPSREFKTPTLRNVARTAPYMHEGNFATLAEVVEFYDTLAGAAPPMPGGERLLQPLGLSAAERADLVAFLESLNDEPLPPELRGPPATPYLTEAR